MASIALNITYGASSKKFTIPKSTTISQLVSEALPKFGISKEEYTGTLSYNSKPLDSSLPIRLTPLLNNSKLKLSVSKLDLDFDVNVKLMVDGASSIKKCGASLTVRELLDLFAVDLTRDSEVRILDLKLTSSSGQYDSVKLGSVVTKKVGSVVIRLNYSKSVSEQEKINLEQQEAVKLQLEGERKRKLEEAERRRQEEEKANTERLLKEQKQEQEEKTAHVEPMDIDEEKPLQQFHDHKKVLEDADSATTPSKQSTPIDPVYVEEPLAETPQLYVPSTSSKVSTYENPDEDYEMTLGQAKAYHNIVKNSGVRKKKVSPSPASLPSKYLIRVKFPDLTILQINFLEDVHLVKFGQLVKRIDELLYPDFINGYNLKLGYPPFSPLGQSFDMNSKLLHEMSDFKSERITLIWELVKNDLNISGPYVKSEGDVTVRATTEMPVQVLESIRGELPDDEQEKKPPKEVTGQASSESKKPNKLPKWLKFK